ncbi:MAG: hypothetical protein AB8F74_23110 [Saprospiraceae bacterium]
MKYNLTTESENTLMEHVYAFIDSKLQFINYQIDAAVKTFEVNDSFSPASFQFPLHSSTTRFENVLASIEMHSKMKGKLLLMRSKLADHNAQLSFDLLTENKYMVYTEKRLISMLDFVEEGTEEIS